MSFTALSEGGEYKHTLTLNESPSHDHYSMYQVSSDGNYGSNYNGLPFVRAGGVSATSSRWSTEKKGGGLAHNTMQPYTCVYFWRRVS